MVGGVSVAIASEQISLEEHVQLIDIIHLWHSFLLSSCVGHCCHIIAACDMMVTASMAWMDSTVYGQ